MGGANGLIVAGVVAIWAAYFVPLVLRRYDDATASTSLENLSSRSRVIGRRAPESGEHAVDPAGDSTEDTTSSRSVTPEPEQARRTERAQEKDRRPVPALTRQAAIIAARRRRRTLLTLLAGLVVVGGLAAFSVIASWWVAAPVALVAAWLVACRVQVRAERGLGSVSLPSRGSRPARAAKAQRARGAAVEEDTVIVELDDVEPDRRHVMEQAPLAEDSLDDQIVIAVPSVSTAGEALWDPLPVTLPTYVTKPRVGRTVRTIDFDAPATWTSGHVEGEDVELPGRSAANDEQRRASGE